MTRSSREKSIVAVSWNRLWLHLLITFFFALGLILFKANADTAAVVEAYVRAQFQTNIQFTDAKSGVQYSAESVKTAEQLSTWLQVAMSLRNVDSQNTIFTSTLGQSSPNSTSKWTGTPLSLSEPSDITLSLRDVNNIINNQADTIYQSFESPYDSCTSALWTGLTPITTGLYVAQKADSQGFLFPANMTIISFTPRTGLAGSYDVRLRFKSAITLDDFGGNGKNLCNLINKFIFCEGDIGGNPYNMTGQIYDDGSVGMGIFLPDPITSAPFHNYAVFRHRPAPMCPKTYLINQNLDLYRLIVRCNVPTNTYTNFLYLIPNNYNITSVGPAPTGGAIISDLFRDNAVVGNFTSSVWLNLWVFNSANSVVSFVLMQWAVQPSGKLKFDIEVSSVLICGITKNWPATILAMFSLSFILNIGSVIFTLFLFRKHPLFTQAFKIKLMPEVFRHIPPPTIFEVLLELGQMITLLIFLTTVGFFLNAQTLSPTCSSGYSDCTPEGYQSKVVAFRTTLRAGENLLSTRITVLFLGSFLMIMLALRLLTFIPRRSYLALIPRLLVVATHDLFHFGIIFFLIIVGYAIAGYLLFSHALPDFESVEKSIQKLLSMLISADLFLPSMTAVYVKHSFFMALYSISFGVLGMLVLANIFIAIVGDAMSLAKRDLRKNEAMSVPGNFVRGLQSRFRLVRKLIQKTQEKPGEETQEDGGDGEDPNQTAGGHSTGNACCIHSFALRQLSHENQVCQTCAIDIPPSTPPRNTSAGMHHRRVSGSKEDGETVGIGAC